jgi:hypothetical protein
MPRASVWDDNRWLDPPPPVSLPTVRLPALDVEIERRAVAEKFARARVVRQGQEAWLEIGRAESFEAWKRIGAALAVGKAHALNVTGANAAWGRNYSRAFSEWSKQYHFDRMPASTRSVCIVLAEHESEITKWRDALPQRQRQRLIHPLSVIRRWKAATGQYPAQHLRDLKWDAQTAWQRFISCVAQLPPDQAAPLWQAVCAEATAHQACAS